MSAPALNRTPMAPESWPPSSKFERCPADDNVQPEQAGSRPDGNCSPDPCGEWRRSGALRRLILLFLMLGQCLLATHFMRGVLPYHGGQPLELVILVLFAILSLWVSAGFWTAIMGFLLLLRGDRYAISASGVDDSPISERARTAVVMPICNEDVGRVFAGLQATYRSLAQTREAGSFDFYILSDSSDPDTRVAETEAWFEMCRAVNDFGRVFYRWRQHRIKRKSGNIADFCRRWGSNYQYMVVLDADSVMSGECLTKLVRLMQPTPPPASFRRRPARWDATRCTRAFSNSPAVFMGRCLSPGCISGSLANRITGGTTPSFAWRPSCATARSAVFPAADLFQVKFFLTILSKPR